MRQAVVSFKAEAKELYGNDNLRIVDNASNAEPPYNVKKELQLAIATGAGFVVSLIVLFFIYDASGGKAGKLGGTKKQRAPKQPRAAVTTRDSQGKTKTTKDSKVKAFFAQLGRDFKDGLWIEPSAAVDVSRENEKPAKDVTKK